MIDPINSLAFSVHANRGDLSTGGNDRQTAEQDGANGSAAALRH